MHFDEALADRQTQPCPAAAAVERWIRLKELVEDVRQLVGGDAGTRVAHADDDFALDLPRRKLDDARLGEAAGVVEQIEDHLTNARAVNFDHRQSSGALQFEANVAPLNRMLDDFEGILQERRQPSARSRC